jgi:glycosyltransferase involved in cell wall biosynthesis
MKIAFVCDWLTGMRGGERCLDVLCELYPEADIFTLVHLPGSVSKSIESHRIYTSYIQQLPGDIKKFRRYLPLYPNAIQHFDLSDHDCVLSLSHCVAKGVKTLPNTKHICYCFTPMRYAWFMRDEYLSKFSSPKRLFAEVVLNYLKIWDRKSSFKVTRFIAISKNVQRRIAQAYNRRSVIIYPPVECQRFTVSDSDDGYYLVVSALVPYKRIDIAVKAFENMHRKLVIVGNGPELPYLKKNASRNILFVEDASDSRVVEYMKKCSALLFPGEEDFGIVPLEAQACGKPVIAFGKGGALETVIGLHRDQCGTNNCTGIFFYEQTPETLRKTILLFERIRDRFDPSNCRKNALKFDRSVYRKSMQDYIKSVMEELG